MPAEPAQEDVRRLRALIDSARRVAVFTGAGISTESGIPDFRSPGTGVWNRIKPIEFQDFLASEAVRRESWRRRFASDGASFDAARPNQGHLAVARLVAAGKADGVITQNVDNLHQDAGVPDDQVVELHGNTRYAKCLDCDRRFELADLKRQFEARGSVPPCAACGGIVKTATISFGQPMPAEAMARAQALADACDLFLAIGSSLVVYPAAGFPEYAKRRGARLAIVNREPTPLDSMADLALHREIGPTLSAVVGDHKAAASASESRPGGSDQIAAASSGRSSSRQSMSPSVARSSKSSTPMASNLGRTPSVSRPMRLRLGTMRA